MSECRYLDFFMGANTPSGFVSRFDKLGDPADGWRLWVIKGGPGTGKSTLMKKVRSALEPVCGEIHNIHCSADVGSLDAVVFPEHRLAIADGTPPHPIEPRYPGAFENVVSVCGCWDKDALYARRRQIMELSSCCSYRHAEAATSLRTVRRLVDEGALLTARCCDFAKIEAYAERFAEKEFPKEAARAGRETVRLMSAVTDKGAVVFSDTARKLAPRLWRICDDWGVAGASLLGHLRRRAFACGLDTLCCYSPFDPLGQLDHLFIPSLGIGFVTDSALLPAALPEAKTIRSERFMLKGCAPEKRRMAFLVRTAVSVEEIAAGRTAEAKAGHDRLEKLYSAAMDFEAVERIAAATAGEMLRACR